MFKCTSFIKKSSNSFSQNFNESCTGWKNGWKSGRKRLPSTDIPIFEHPIPKEICKGGKIVEECVVMLTIERT